MTVPERRPTGGDAGAPGPSQTDRPHGRPRAGRTDGHAGPPGTGVADLASGREPVPPEAGTPSVTDPLPTRQPATHTPRERMVFSAAQLIRRDGVRATGMRDVAAHAQAPRGSLQHYFPGGKEQLVNEAVSWAGRYAGNRVARFLAAMSEPTPSGLFSAMVRQWTDELQAADYALGCPVAAATVDCAESAASTRAAAAAAFATWNAPVAQALATMGVPAAQAPSLATLMISTLEGALLIARSEQDIRALTTVADQLGPLLDACVITS
jgi:AcrR family transcriptional regulator